ncbi:hypothetical protein [Gracilimonas sp.]|uniref:hypothetical protein n=1 Tax=Gracilimonas sp. TaxID=1974203 RepID=UPI00287169A7|nr:hypothetical protein [Gracilimonas sp.]
MDDWVLPESIIVIADQDSISSDSWYFDEATGLISFDESGYFEFTDSQNVIVSFEVYPLSLSRQFQLVEPVEIDASFFENQDSLDQQLTSLNNTAFQESNLRQSGSLSRGIIVGSNQDFSLESGLNFELSGALTKDITINASLTDQSIPIQPDGTTQNLREFDKVFIQLNAPNASIEMGDVDVNLDNSRFATLERRLQGASGVMNSDFGDYTAAASVVRGTFKSISFEGQEGVQGPYRLTGDNDREFVIILAGTEKVYINGQRVQRGAENDYIIDYGLGEITFTNNLLIKDETRIVIEYEYVDQNFNRTLVAAEGGSKFMDGKLEIGATVIRQADGDDLLSQQTLSRNDIERLEEVGDNIDEVFTDGARIASEEEREQFVLYVRVDTTLNGQDFTIYEHRPGSDESIYRVQFSKIGEGQGSYRRVSGEVNGLLYEWVGPNNGSYSSQRPLPAPEKQQMAALNGRFKISENITAFGEWAVSDFDANRFSPLDDEDNTDMGYESGIELMGVATGLGELNAEVRRLYYGRNFQAFDRIKDVEFNRKWNVSDQDASKEAINEIRVSLSPNDRLTIGGEIGILNRNSYEGTRQSSFLVNEGSKFLNVNYSQDFVKNDDRQINQRGSWFRQQGNMLKELSIGEIMATPYVRFEHENRIQRDLSTDSLMQRSEIFYDVGPGLRLNYQNFEFDISFAHRQEKGVIKNSLENKSTALEQRYRLIYNPGKAFNTTNEVRYRNKQFTEAFVNEGNSSRKGLLIKSVTNYSSPNNFIDGELFYEANTERRALLQESYIQVRPEIGQYVWDDINRDGVQQIDEFFPEISPNEGTFIKQYLPSDELNPVVDLSARWINTISPFKNREEEHWLSGMKLNSRVDITENSTTDRLSDIYLLKLKTFRNDSTTVQGRLLWEQELDVFSDSRKVDLTVGYFESKGLNQQSSESIESFTNSGYLNSGYDVTNKVRVTFNARVAKNKSESSRFQTRNYNIRSYSVRPGINGTINRSWNANVEISYAQKSDKYPLENVKAELLKVTTSHRTYLWNTVQSNFRVELRKTELSGRSSSYGNYELTEGTGEGTNLIWSINSTYRANRLINLSFQYDGRTVSDRPSIHTIKFIVSANF